MSSRLEGMVRDEKDVVNNFSQCKKGLKLCKYADFYPMLIVLKFQLQNELIALCPKPKVKVDKYG